MRLERDKVSAEFPAWRQAKVSKDDFLYFFLSLFLFSFCLETKVEPKTRSCGKGRKPAGALCLGPTLVLAALCGWLKARSLF